MELNRANLESGSEPNRKGIVLLCAAILIAAALLWYFYGSGWAEGGTRATPKPGTGISSPEDPATADPALKAARLTTTGDLEVTALLRDFQMRDNKRPEIVARFGQKYLKCEVQRLVAKVETGEAVLYRFADSNQARAAQQKISVRRNPATPTFQIGPVVACVYGGKTVVQLASQQFRQLSKAHESD